MMEFLETLLSNFILQEEIFKLKENSLIIKKAISPVVEDESSSVDYH